MGLISRQYYSGNVCYDNNGNAYYCQSSWNTWGRWVALVCVIIGAFLFFFLLSCLSARRRKRAGQQPYYGTGWVGRTPFGHGQAVYNPNVATQRPQQETYGNGNNQQYNSPPAYGQQGGASADYYGNQNRGYFGGQQDTEMQPPQAVYGGNTYQPPTGPPPKKV